MAPKLSPPRLAQPVAIIFMHGLLFGINFITLCLTNRWLIFTDEGWKVRKRLHWLLIIIANFIGALSLVDVSVDVRVISLQMDFVDAGNKPLDWVAPPWNGIVRCMLADTIALCADIVLMNRLWVVYGKNKPIMVFPIILWLGGIVCGILQIFLQTVHIHNPNFGPYQWGTAVNMNVGPGIVLTPLWASTTALNLYCTGLLIWRIWRVARKAENKSSFTRKLQFLIRILMESGVLYFAVGFAHLFAWFGRNSFAISLLGTMNSATIPIAFNLVVIRIAQNRASGEEPDYTTPGVVSTIHFTGGPAGDSGSIIHTSLETGPTMFDLGQSKTNFTRSKE